MKYFKTIKLANKFYSLAQSSMLRDKLNSLYQDLNALSIGDPGIMTVVQAGAQGAVDKTKLIPALEAALLKFPKDEAHWRQLDNLREILAELKGEPTPQPTTRGLPSQKVPYTANTAEEAEEYARSHPSELTKKTDKFKAIPVATQMQLNEILTELKTNKEQKRLAGEPYIQDKDFPKLLSLDGKLGPDTANALDVFAKVYSAPDKSIKGLIDSIDKRYYYMQMAKSSNKPLT